MAEKKKNTPAKVEEQTTALASFEGMDEYTGRGFQNQTQDDIAIPFLNLLQALSPETQEGDGHIEGAKPGLWMNSVTQELDKGFEFVPALTEHCFMEWVPRSQGGGLVGKHSPNSPLVKKAKETSQDFGKYTNPETGNDLVETFYVFGITCKGDSPVGMAVLAFTSTKIKAYKAIMGRLNAFQLQMPDKRRITPPLFAHRLLISSKSEKNSKGTFYVPTIQPAVENDVLKSLLGTNDPRFQMAAQCEALVSSGAAKADMNGQEQGPPPADDVDNDLF